MRSPRWPRSSCRASMPRPTPCSRPARTCAVASRSPTPASHTPATATASPTRAGSPCAKPARRPQRPLWASTATKDPAYSDVLYVEALIAPDVINTMPEATLRAFADHGDATRAFDPSSHCGRRDAPTRRGRRHRPRRSDGRPRAGRCPLLLRLLPRPARLHRDQARAHRRPVGAARAPLMTRAPWA